MYQYVKRGIDFILSFVACLLLFPLLLIIAVAIKTESKGPVLFGQKRVGKGKKIFTMYKFRTMRTDTPHDIPTHLLENPEIYITKVGKFLRRTSLDELPQLVHILLGQMAIIGPRPALWNQDDLIELRDKYGANHIRPGLTGWAQINGRDELSLEDKAAYDGEYADKFSFLFDCRIFLGTIFSVIRADGLHEGCIEVKDKK